MNKGDKVWGGYEATVQSESAMGDRFVALKDGDGNHFSVPASTVHTIKKADDPSKDPRGTVRISESGQIAIKGRNIWLDYGITGDRAPVGSITLTHKQVEGWETVGVLWDLVVVYRGLGKFSEDDPEVYRVYGPEPSAWVHALEDGPGGDWLIRSKNGWDWVENGKTGPGLYGTPGSWANMAGLADNDTLRVVVRQKPDDAEKGSQTRRIFTASDAEPPEDVKLLRELFPKHPHTTYLRRHGAGGWVWMDEPDEDLGAYARGAVWESTAAHATSVLVEVHESDVPE